MNLMGFLIFEKYFLYINLKYNKVNYETKILRVTADKIIGIDSLWTILTNTNTEVVRVKAAKLLVSLTIYLKSFSDINMSINYWNNSLEKFYSVLNSKIQKNEENNHDNNNSNNNASNGIIGLIKFINTLFKEVDNGGEVIASDYVQFYNKGDEYTFICPEKNFKQAIIIGTNEPVWSVREKISYYTKIPINNVFLKNNKRFINYNDDFTLFNSLAIKNFIVDVLDINNIVGSLSTNPCTIIKQDDRLFNGLFKLLRQYKTTDKEGLNGGLNSNNNFTLKQGNNTHLSYLLFI